MTVGRGRGWIVSALVAAVCVAAAGPAEADVGYCSASAVDIAGLQPITANPALSPCAAEYHAADRANLTAGDVHVTVHTARAITDLAPFSTFSADLRAGDEYDLAASSVNSVTITVRGNVIQAEGLRAYLDCHARRDTTEGTYPGDMRLSSAIGKLRVNGVATDVLPVEDLGIGIYGFDVPIPGVGTLHVQSLVPPHTDSPPYTYYWTARALWLEGPGVDVSVAEARLSGFTVPACPF